MLPAIVYWSLVRGKIHIGNCSSYCLLIPSRRSKRGTCYYTAAWLGGWLDVTRRFCIKTAKPVLELFRPPGSTIILILF